MGKKTKNQTLKEVLGQQVKILPANLLAELKNRVEMTNQMWHLHRLVSQNTAMHPRGKERAKELEAEARLLENDKDMYINYCVKNCGFEFPPDTNISISAEGVISVVEDGKP